MKPTLIAEPYGSYIANILKAFENEKPLTAEQINFIARHEKILSQYALDPVIRYYLKKSRDKKNSALTFSFNQEKLNQSAIKHVKKYIQELLQHNLSHVDLKMTLTQFKEFQKIGIHELIFWHGNQFLTGAPFHLGGIPHVIYVQWGNLFGIVKLQLTPEDKLVKGSVLIEFEERHNRSLYQCVKDYSHEHKVELLPKSKLIETVVEDKTLIHQNTLVLKPFFHEIH